MAILYARAVLTQVFLSGAIKFIVKFMIQMISVF